MASTSKHTHNAPKTDTCSLRPILDAVTTQIWTLSASNTYGTVNKAHASFFGLSKENLTNKNISDVLPEKTVAILQKGIQTVFTTKQVFTSEEILTNSKGEQRILFVSKTPLQNNNIVEHIIYSAADITEQKAKETACKKYATNFNMIMDNLLVGVVIYSSDSSILSSNLAASNILGLTPEQIKGKQAIDPVWKFVREDLSVLPLEDYPVNKVISSGKPLTEYLTGIIKPNKDNITWVIINAIPVFTETLSLDRVIVNFSDVTKHKQAEQELKESMAKFSSMYSNAPLSYQSLDINGKLLDVNPTWAKTLGYNRDEVIGKNFSLFLHPDSKEHFATNFPNFKKCGYAKDVQFKIRHKDNHYLSINFEGIAAYNPDKTFKQTYCVFQDITSRKKTEKALADSEKKLQNIIQNSTNLFYSHNTDHILNYLSPQVEQILGYTVEEAMKNWTNFASDNPVNNLGYNYTVKAIETGKRQPPYELELIRKDGKKIWVEAREFPLVENGKVTAIIGSLAEITERKAAVTKLKESEVKFRTIFENKGTATGIFKNDGIIADCNHLFVKLSGYTKTEIVNKMKWSSFVVKEDLEKMLGYSQQRSQKTGTPPTQYECRMANKSGKIFNVLVNIAMVGETRIVSLVDITDRKKAQLEIERMQKLEGLGTIAGGIAHDFNNLLTGVFANLEMAKLDLPKNTNSYHYLEEANHAIQSARSLTGQLLTFAKGGTPVISKVDTVSLLKNTVEFNLHGSKVIPKFKLPKNLWAIKADKGQIEQVIANLVINAKQSMPSGGTLQVEALNNYRDNDSDENSNHEEVLISIIDEGIGIPEKIIKNIFDPYFSTKDTGHGLGLAVVYSIIQQHEGNISVKSIPNIGTTFKILLPALKTIKQAKTLQKAKTNTPIEKNNSLNILIMDDEAIIRDIAKQLIERLGHLAATSTDGDDAMHKYKNAIQHNKPFDLVIMDLTIRGGKGGEVTIKELLEFDPEAKVIVSSGYSSGALMSNYKSYGFSGKLAKPFLAAELKDEINRVIKLK